MCVNSSYRRIELTKKSAGSTCGKKIFKVKRRKKKKPAFTRAATNTTFYYEFISPGCMRRFT